MRPLLAAVAAAALCAPIPAVADHMNGEFFGIGPWAEYSLDLFQDGWTVEAEIMRCDELVVELEGAGDGDMAQGRAYSLESGSQGGFYLQWSPGAVMLVVDLDGMRYEAAFGTRPSPNNCASEYDDDEDGDDQPDWPDIMQQTPEQPPDEPDDGDPFPNY